MGLAAPAGRPLVIVADGFFPFLRPDDSGLRASIRIMNLFPGVADRSDLGVLRLQFSSGR